jgi:LexA-binding, inner membrane-associated putative hydrolase
LSPVTHFLTGWVLAATSQIERRDRALVTLSAVIPDVDGLGAIPEFLTRNSSHQVLWFSKYHHSLHTLLFALAVSLLAALVARQRWKTSVLCFVGFHLHLLEDVLGSRAPDGDQWPISYFAPFSSHEWTWRGQWYLNAWPNFVITIALLIMTIYLAWLKGYSPLEMISSQADAEFVNVIRRRLPRKTPSA